MKAPRSIWLIAGGAAVAAGAVAWLAGQGGWAAALVAVGVLLPVAAFLADKASARAGDLDIEKVADRLADLVRDQWDKEATRRGVGRPPLEVFWQAADADLVHTWPELQQQAATGRSGPASATPGSGPDDLAGHGALLTAYDRSPCGRLVVLGQPGAGKTVLLLRLVLDLLARRQPGQPVPLLVPLASWNPDGLSLYAWLEGQILREYPHLASVDAATGRKRAGALLDAGLILPVLDGLDEIRAGSRDQGMVAINDGLRSNVGLVLSCRADEFRVAVRPRPDLRSIHLDGAAGVRLMPLTPAAIGDYLLSGAGDGGLTRWAQVLSALTDPMMPVTQALTTPLAASLAGTIYNPRQGKSTIDLPNPSDLCAFAPTETVERHLLAGFISAAYRPHPDQPTRWTAEQATRYIAFLARHLEHHLCTTSLAWWELPQAIPRALPIPAVGLTVGLAAGISAGLTGVLLHGSMILQAGITLGLVVGSLAGPTTRLRLPSPRHTAVRWPQLSDIKVGLAVGLAVGIAVGIAVDLAAGLTTGLAAGLAAGFHRPSRRQLVLRRPRYSNLAARLRRSCRQLSLWHPRYPTLTLGLFGLLFTLVFGLTAGIISFFIYALLIGVNHLTARKESLHWPQLADLRVGLTVGIVFGIAFGPGHGLAYGLAAGLLVGLRLDTTVDVRRTADPWTVLIYDRTIGLAAGLAVGLSTGLFVGLAVVLAHKPEFGLLIGCLSGSAAGVEFALDSAWGRLGLARLWLAALRQQPLHLMAFLKDAHDRGVLRQAGAVWEFRHANLQRYLANRP